MTHNVDKTVDNSDLGENGVVVTEAMIEAGVYALEMDCNFRMTKKQLVETIYKSMASEHLFF